MDAPKRVNIGQRVNDKTGDDPRTAFNKLNQNNDAFYAAIQDLQTAGGGKLDAAAAPFLSLFLNAALGLPFLPGNDADIPAAGGWFRSGDSRSFSLIYIAPQP